MCCDVWSITCDGVGMVDSGIFDSIALSLIALACWLCELHILWFLVSFLLLSFFLLCLTLARLDGILTLSKIDCVLGNMVPILLCNSDFKLESSSLMTAYAPVLDCCSCLVWLEMAVW